MAFGGNGANNGVMFGNSIFMRSNAEFGERIGFPYASNPGTFRFEV